MKMMLCQNEILQKNWTDTQFHEMVPLSRSLYNYTQIGDEIGIRASN
jgi:hypothetical protein